jgi:hypothetical protein
MPYARFMKTPYHGRARIGDLRADVDIVNVDVSRWKGTATNVDGVAAGGEAIVTLLEQPRPGWSARAVATGGADGVLLLEGNGQFFAPSPPRVAPGRRSRWVRKSPWPT